MLNYGIGCALENDWRHAENFVDLLRDSNIGDTTVLEKKVQMHSYLEKVILSSSVTTKLATAGKSVFLGYSLRMSYHPSAEQKKEGDSSLDELEDRSPIIHSHSSENTARHIQERSGDDSRAT